MFCYSRSKIAMRFLITMQSQCKPSAENLFYAEAPPDFAVWFSITAQSQCKPDFAEWFPITMQSQCKPSAENSFYAEAPPDFAVWFSITAQRYKASAQSICVVEKKFEKSCFFFSICTENTPRKGLVRKKCRLLAQRFGMVGENV